MSAELDAVVATLREHGIRLASGVPCSILEPLQLALEHEAGLTYVPASVEGEAVASPAQGIIDSRPAWDRRAGSWLCIFPGASGNHR